MRTQHTPAAPGQLLVSVCCLLRCFTVQKAFTLQQVLLGARDVFGEALVAVVALAVCDLVTREAKRCTLVFLFGRIISRWERMP
jgi:hypothetical protein